MPWMLTFGALFSSNCLGAQFVCIIWERKKEKERKKERKKEKERKKTLEFKKLFGK